MSIDYSSTMSTKKCSTCGTVKSVAKFSKKTRSKDGFNGQCKDCQSAYYRRFYAERREEQCCRVRKYREENPPTQEQLDSRKQKAAEWRRWNIDEISARRRVRYWDEETGIRKRNIERTKEWVKKNIAAVYEQRRLYYRANAESIKARVRKYEKENPEITKALGRVKANRRRARLSASQAHYTRHDISRMYKAQRGKCANCRCSIVDGYYIDHRVPVAKGGDNSPGNIELLCPRCNLAKGAKMPHEFAKENGRLL